MTSRPILPLRSLGGWILALAALGVLAALSTCGREDPPTPRRAAGEGYDADGHRRREDPAPAHPPNLILVVIDTLRADAVRTREGGEGSMPYLASLAREGTTFTNAAAAAPWTLPSITSLLTGVLPHVHGLAVTSGVVTLPQVFTTFAEALRNGYGYETAAFVGLPSFAEQSTLFQGFSKVTADFSLQATAALVPPWAKSRDARRPFFLLLHTYDAHDAYGEKNHPWPRVEEAANLPGGDPLAGVDALEAWEVARRCALDWRANVALNSSLSAMRTHERVLRYLWSGFRNEPRPDLARELEDAYREGTRWTDGLLRTSMETLRGLGLLENTVVIVTGDHGEAFGEHGILLHGRQLYDELVHVPLVVFGTGPFRGGHVVEGSVGLVDVLPTFFEHAGLDALTDVEGRSALAPVKGGGDGRPVLSEEQVTAAATGGEADQYVVSARSSRWKYVATYDKREGTVKEEAYDLVADPGERSDLVRGAGALDASRFGAPFCEAVETARDRLWTVVEETDRLVARDVGPPGAKRVTSARPTRTCPSTAAPPR